MNIYKLPIEISDFISKHSLDIAAYNKFNTPFSPKTRETLNELLNSFPDQVDGLQLDNITKEKLLLDTKGIELPTLGIQYTVKSDSILKIDTITNPKEKTVTALSQNEVSNSYAPLLPGEWKEDLERFTNLHNYHKEVHYSLLIEKYKNFPNITKQQVDILLSKGIEKDLTAHNGIYIDLLKTKYYESLTQKNLLELDPVKTEPIHKLLLQAEINSKMRFGGDGQYIFNTKNPQEVNDYEAKTLGDNLQRIKNLKSFEVELYGDKVNLLLEDKHLEAINSIISKLEKLQAQGQDVIFYGKSVVDTSDQQNKQIESTILNQFYTSEGISNTKKLDINNYLSETYHLVSISSLINLFKEKTILSPLPQEGSYLILLEPQDLESFTQKLDNPYNLSKEKEIKLREPEDFINLNPTFFQESLALGIKYEIPLENDIVYLRTENSNLIVFTDKEPEEITISLNETYSQIYQSIKNIKSDIIIFHTGRGGQFYNQGYKKCEGIADSFDPSKYGIDFNYDFEDSFYVENIIHNTTKGMNPHLFLEQNNFDLAAAATNWTKELQEKFDSITPEGITHELLGEPVIRLNNGEIACTVKELRSKKGTFNIDNDYNSYHWAKADIETLSEEEVRLIVRDLDNYQDVLKQCGVDSDVLKLMELFPDINDKVYGIIQNNPYIEQEITNGGDIQRFDSLEEMEEEGYKEEQAIELNNRYYINTNEQSVKKGQRL